MVRMVGWVRVVRVVRVLEMTAVPQNAISPHYQGRECGMWCVVRGAGRVVRGARWARVLALPVVSIRGLFVL